MLKLSPSALNTGTFRMEIVDVYNYIIQLNIKQLNIILKAVNFFAKCSILYVWHGPEYASA